MKVYVAGNFENKSVTRKIYRLIKSKGHEISFDWTKHLKTLPEDRNKKSKLVSKYALEDFEGIVNAEVVIVLSDPDHGKGKFVELGIALHSSKIKGKPKIYIVGDRNNQTIFYFHPAIKRKKTIEEVLEDLPKA